MPVISALGRDPNAAVASPPETVMGGLFVTRKPDEEPLMPTSNMQSLNSPDEIISQSTTLDDGTLQEDFFLSGVLILRRLTDLADLWSWDSVENTYVDGVRTQKITRFDDGSHRKDGTGRMMSPIEHYARWTKGESLGTSSFFVDESIIPNQDAKLGRKDKCLPFYAGTNN